MWKRGVVGVLLFAALSIGAHFIVLPTERGANSAAAAPALGGRSIDSLTLITEPDQGIAPILSLISSASSSVDVVMYQFEDTQIEAALAQDASRGVKVRVLLNSGYYGKKENDDNDAAYAYFRQHGINVEWTPARFALTHQKTIVIDDKAAAILTLNFTPQYYASSRDFVILDSDVNDVDAIEDAFNADRSDKTISSENGDGLVWSPGSQDALLSLINSAQTSLDVYNEEMNDAAITKALVAAAQRGVKVRIDMTYSSEWKKSFQQLAAAGAQVRTYAANAPLYIHAKMIIADNSEAFVGSENFSSGSLNKNRELGITLSDTNVISSLETTFQRDWSGATVFD